MTYISLEGVNLTLVIQFYPDSNYAWGMQINYGDFDLSLEKLTLKM